MNQFADPPREPNTSPVSMWGGAAPGSLDKSQWWIYGSRFGLILFIGGVLLAVLYGIIDDRVSERFHQIELVMTTNTNAIDTLQKELKGVRAHLKTTNEILTDVRVSLSHIEGALSNPAPPPLPKK